jgi:hypothetical protein
MVTAFDCLDFSSPMRACRRQPDEVFGRAYVRDPEKWLKLKRQRPRQSAQESLAQAPAVRRRVPQGEGLVGLKTNTLQTPYFSITA